MKISRQEEIDELAERVIAKYSSVIPIDPLEIAERINVKVIADSYENYFKGFICYDGNSFYIMLNLDELKDIRYSISRYTCSHELGHYFIGTHRKRLKKGESFAFLGKGAIHPDKRIIELEAEQFAASLLMPKTHFIEYFNSIDETGFEAILNLKSYFDVSITSALIRFNKLNITPCITIVWKENKLIGKGVSTKFSNLIEPMSPDEVVLKINPDRPRIEEKKMLHKFSGVEYYRTITPLSSWVFNISTEVSNGFFVIEETLYGKWANITILYPVSN